MYGVSVPLPQRRVPHPRGDDCAEEGRSENDE